MTIQDLYNLYAEAEKENRLIYDGLDRYRKRISEQKARVDKIEQVKDDILEKAEKLGVAPTDVISDFNKMIYNLTIYKEDLEYIEQSLKDVSFLSLLE